TIAVLSCAGSGPTAASARPTRSIGVGPRRVPSGSPQNVGGRGGGALRPVTGARFGETANLGTGGPSEGGVGEPPRGRADLQVLGMVPRSTAPKPRFQRIESRSLLNMDTESSYI